MNQTQKFINEQIEVLDRLFTKGAHTHLVLAGNPRAVARVRKHLPRRLGESVIDVVPVAGDASTADVVGATLSTYADYEQTESLGTVDLFLDELKTGGLAVAGTAATLNALARGQVDILLLVDTYAEPAAWKCRKCDVVGVTAAVEVCPHCGARAVARVQIKEEMTRSAEQLGCTVEIVRGSDVMLAVGGVGCLLRYLMPEQRA
jgi:peptide subunit release factor 1 (eRF1)